MNPEVPYVVFADEFDTSINPSESCDTTLSLGSRVRDHRTMVRGRIVANLVLLGVSIFVFVSGFQSLQNLASSLNPDMGTESQAVIFAVSMLSCLLMPDLLVKTFGAKRTLVCSILFSVPYLACNYSPSYWPLMISSSMIGFALGFQNSAAALYINEMGRRFVLAKNDGYNMEVVLAFFYGGLSFFMENTQIYGNLISYYVLRPGMAPIHPSSRNITCGVHFNLSTNASTGLEPPTDEQLHLLASVYLLAGILSVVLMGLFMDKLENDVDNGGGNRTCRSKLKATLKLLSATFRLMFKPDQQLLIPITIFIGCNFTFYTSQVTEAYIACSWGVHHVGFVTVCFGVCGAITALLVGPMVKCFSQMAVILFAAAANVGICVFLFFWQPSPEHPYLYFIVAGVWGMGDAIWWSQITALYGLMFPEDREAAFSNLYFWSFFGFFISYSYANSITVAVKIYILLTFLGTGILCYLIGQLRHKCSGRTHYAAVPQDVTA